MQDIHKITLLRGSFIKIQERLPKSVIERTVQMQSSEGGLYNKGGLKNFVKFTRRLGWPATLLKNRLWHRCFPVNFTKFLRTPFLIWLF